MDRVHADYLLIDEISLEVLTTLRVTQLRKRLCLDLANSLAGDPKGSTNLFEGARTAIVETEAQPDDLLLPRCELAKNLGDLDT